VTVSSASMYWLLRHAQHARDINIHELHPLPEKNSALAALPIFCTVEHLFNAGQLRIAHSKSVCDRRVV